MPSGIETVWDIEGALEMAIVDLFANIITALSNQDPQKFDKDRCRVDIKVSLGTGNSKHLAMSETTGLECDVENAWAVNLRATLVTEADMAVHGPLRARVRHTMHRLPPLLNDTGLTNHVIYGPISHAGSSFVSEPTKGMYHTVMVFNAIVSIHEQAWQLITGSNATP